MNRTAAFLLLLGGSAAGGFALLSQTLAPSGQFIVECAPPDGDCVLVTKPRADQCAVLLEGGGDRPGELSGLDGAGAAAARALYGMQEAKAISGFRTVTADGGCKTAIALSRSQAREWRDTLTGASESGAISQAAAVLAPASPTGFPVQWGGAPSPEERVEAFDLTAVDAGVP